MCLPDRSQTPPDVSQMPRTRPPQVVQIYEQVITSSSVFPTILFTTLHMHDFEVTKGWDKRAFLLTRHKSLIQ